MFGITAEQWGIINGFANWLAAIGTISAVAVSLYLSMKSGKRTAKLSARLMLMAEIGSEHHPEHIIFSLVNTGDRTINTDSIGWVVGKKTKQYFIQLWDRTLSHPMPLMQASGVSGKWLFNVDDGRWFSQMAESLGANWKKDIKTLKALATTTTGEEFFATPSKELFEKLKVACELRAPSSA
ncbi:hypothetical protein [Pseudomonas protegens]|uniref:hypothetical protein n=1 Tax=Pseudomonas protegens TaxID=380021 RepID=UPI0024C33A82|nr:hypothetical protein [Pseudomonas protegens]MDK1397979.1 hypothetical protein [Pseudomonas protegens]